MPPTDDTDATPSADQSNQPDGPAEPAENAPGAEEQGAPATGDADGAAAPADGGQDQPETPPDPETGQPDTPQAPDNPGIPENNGGAPQAQNAGANPQAEAMPDQATPDQTNDAENTPPQDPLPENQDAPAEGSEQAGIQAAPVEPAPAEPDFEPLPDMTVETGFHARYFDVDYNLRELADIDWSTTPTHEEVRSDINYQNGRGSFWEGGDDDTFGTQITGNVLVEEAGTFTFHLGGDDGAILFVNGEPLIDNDRLHSFRTESAEVTLDEGAHHIEVRYFENHGHAGLRLEWEGPGIEGRELVAPPDDAAAHAVAGTPMAISVGPADGTMPEGTAIEISGLPEGTILQSGDNAATVGDDGTVDITGWDGAALTVTPPPDFTGPVDATVTATDPDHAENEQTQSLQFDVDPAQVTLPEAELFGGFQASFFDVDHRLRRLDDIDWDSDPTHQEFVQEIDYANGHGSFWEGGSTNTFGARFEGQVTIDEGGVYEFFASGDDGVMLYIDGEPVVNNDGRHGFRTRSGEIELEPGTYDLEVRYFENYGRAGLRIEWEGPDTDGREPVVADPPTTVEANGTLDVGISLSHVSDDATVELSGLPPDTILIAGEDSAVVGDEPVDLEGWDLSALEIAPPPAFEGFINGEIIVTDVAFNGSSVTSATPFSIAVGDAEAAQHDTEDLPADVQPGEDGSIGEDTAWDDPSDQQGDDTEDDVMSEQVETHQDVDVTDPGLDTYERVDW